MEKITEILNTDSPERSGTYGKIVLNFSLRAVAELLGCLLFCGCRIFAGMFPFGLAFYGAIFSKKGWVINFIAAFVGILVFCKAPPGVYLTSLVLSTALLGILDIQLPLRTELLCSASFFVLKLVYLATGSFAVYDIFALVLETAFVFSGVYIFKKGFPTLLAIAGRSYISTSEMLCTFGVIALAAMSLEGARPIFGFTPSGLLSIFMIYIFSLGGTGGGAVVLGVLLGTVGALGRGDFGTLAATYAFGAILASALAPHGKIAVVLGFVAANTFSALFISDAYEVAVSIYDSLGAAAFFFLVPRRLCTHLSGFFAGGDRGFYNSSAAVKRSGDAVASRLDEMSMSFKELSRVYSRGTGDRELGKDYILSKLREVTAQCCNTCPSRQSCFGKNTAATYNQMAKMLETAFKCGKITPHTMPSDFRQKCHRADSFGEKFSSVFNVIKTEKQWLSKLNDSRRLISSQLMAVSDALAREKSKCGLVPDPGLEDKLRAELDKRELCPKEVLAQSREGEDFVIWVTYAHKRTSSATSVETARAIEAAVGCSVSPLSPKHHAEDVSFGFCPTPAYSFLSGYASVPRQGERVCGDSISITNTDGKMVYAMLSDGMGSGEAAAHESKDAICLMEKFLQAGFDVDTAIRLINSSLLLKSSRDSFSTIDLCSCDLSKGELIFTKLGAASSYIKSEGRVRRVNASALPAGILKDIDVENHYLSIASDTTVIMLSDGIEDIALKNRDLDGWLEDELLSLDTSNPQIIASALMKKALKIQGGTAHDDMTIMVLMYKSGNMGK